MDSDRKLFRSKKGNTQNKARKALERQLKVEKKKFLPDGDIIIWKTGDGKYIAHTDITKK